VKAQCELLNELYDLVGKTLDIEMFIPKDPSRAEASFKMKSSRDSYNNWSNDDMWLKEFRKSVFGALALRNLLIFTHSDNTTLILRTTDSGRNKGEFDIDVSHTYGRNLANAIITFNKRGLLG